MSTLRTSLVASALLIVSSLAVAAMQQDGYREVDDGGKSGPPQADPVVARDFSIQLDPKGENSANFSLGFRVAPDKQAQYRLVLDAFRTTPDGPDKEAKKAELKKQLTEIFEADMKAHKAQADEIETRLKKLQEQYKAREAAKERIIDLQIEVLEKDAAGLGFPVAGVSHDLKSVPASKPSANSPNPPTTDETSTNISSLSRHGLPRLQRPLIELMKEEHVLVGHLQKLRLFVVSADNKYFAYPNHDPVSDMSVVYLSDADTGEVIATYDVQGVNLELRFQDGGLAVREDGARFVVRIPLSAEPNHIRPGPPNEHVVADNPLASANQLPSNDTMKVGELDEYSRLRKSYLSAKLQADRADLNLKQQLEASKKANLNISEEDLKTIQATSADYRRSVNSQFREAATILETKIKLLTLDLESARASFNVAEAELAKAQQINEIKRNSVNEIELRRLQLSMEKQKVEVTRAQTILDLFQSIKTDGEPKPDTATELKR